MITGKRTSKSGAGMTVWKLSNGWTLTEQYNSFYGSIVTHLESPDGKLWLASNGESGEPEESRGIGGAENANKIFNTDIYIDLPDFAKEWQDNDRHKLVRPKFKPIFED